MIVVSLLLATMPAWRPDWYRAVLSMPGLGWFRCPGRYSMPAMLGLCLWAGRGFDRSISLKRFRAGLALALFIAIVGFDRIVVLGKRELGEQFETIGLGIRVGLGAAAWLCGIAALSAHRRRWISPLVPIGLCTLELAILYYTSTTQWNWHVRIPQSSPILKRLLESPEPRRVAGFLEDLPVEAGMTAIHPYLVQNLPRPHPSLAAANFRISGGDPMAARLFRRYGARYGVWAEPVAQGTGELIFESGDPALDAIIALPPKMHNPRLWRIVRYSKPFDQARIATRIRVSDSDDEIARALAMSDASDDVWISGNDSGKRSLGGVRAKSASVLSWDGVRAIVRRDGDCVLVINRTFDPGWRVKVNDKPEVPVIRVDGGVQGAFLSGSGESRVEFAYRPLGFAPAAIASGTAAGAAAALVFGLVVVRRIQRKPLTRRGS